MDALIARRLDRELLKQLRGSPAFDPSTGRPIVDSEGKPVLRPPTASLLAVAAKRARPVQPSIGDPDDHADRIRDLMDELAAEEGERQTATPKTDAPDLPA